ncbi:MAG TPA: hypothetical protein PLT35_04805 [Vicinamibacterales bacterium]|nr:hypothetical protein [Vicinamibacterales bacterium]
MRRIAAAMILALPGVLAALPAAADPLPAVSDRVVQYHIRAALDTASGKVLLPE